MIPNAIQKVSRHFSSAELKYHVHNVLTPLIFLIKHLKHVKKREVSTQRHIQEMDKVVKYNIDQCKMEHQLKIYRIKLPFEICLPTKISVH